MNGRGKGCRRDNYQAAPCCGPREVKKAAVKPRLQKAIKLGKGEVLWPRRLCELVEREDRSRDNEPGSLGKSGTQLMSKASIRWRTTARSPPTGNYSGAM